MKSIYKITIFLVICLSLIHATMPTLAAQGDDPNTPKTALLGSNSGTISSNTAGGKFYFLFTLTDGVAYDFSLSGDTNTKFDLYLYDWNYLPAFVTQDSQTYADSGSYPVKITYFDTENEQVLIQVFSDHETGGTGDFTLEISESTGEQSEAASGFIFFPVILATILPTIIRKIKHSKHVR